MSFDSRRQLTGAEAQAVMEILLDKRAVRQIRQSGTDAIEDGDTETLREDVMDAWRSSCPRFPVWEDARADGLIRQCGGDSGEHRVELTERGRAALRRAAIAPRSSRSQIAASGSGP